MRDEKKPGPRLLVWPELRDRGVVKSRRQVDRDEAAGRFPQRVHYGDNRVAWVAEEIDRHVEQRIAARSIGVSKV